MTGRAPLSGTPLAEPETGEAAQGTDGGSKAKAAEETADDAAITDTDVGIDTADTGTCLLRACW
ncbi:hypothetical protein SABIM44S_00129 [Streptomyces abikoensis]